MYQNTLPTLDPLDKRLQVFRDGIVDQQLQGKVNAKKYVRSQSGNICVPVTDLKPKPDTQINNDHQFLIGEPVQIFDDSEGWSLVQSDRDGYVGYIQSRDVETAETHPTPTHVVSVPRTIVYPKAELRNPPKLMLSIGSQIAVSGSETVRGTDYAMLANGGTVINSHLQPLNEPAQDFVIVAEKLLHTPYLWGGASGFGIDCSSLVQLSMRICGREELRDSDMQAATLGDEIDAGDELQNLQRGDLIFWPGHVAIHKGSIHGIDHIIHASGHTMSVAIEPLLPAIERIAYLYQKPIGFRRP